MKREAEDEKHLRQLAHALYGATAKPITVGWPIFVQLGREKPRKDSSQLRADCVSPGPSAASQLSSTRRPPVHSAPRSSKLQTNPSAAVRMQQQASLKKASTAITIEAF